MTDPAVVVSAAAAAPTPVSFLGAEGQRLAADAWGTGPPVVLLHGGGQTRHAWKGTASHIAAAGFRAVAVDLRGHGESDWTADYGLDGFRDDVLAVVDQLGGAAALVGASLGGITSLLAVGESPGEVTTGLVLVDIAPVVEEAGVARIMAFMESHLGGFPSVEEAVTAVARYLPHRRRQPNAASLRRYLRQREDGRLYWHWDPQFIAQARTDHMGTAARQLLAAARVRVPTLLVRGADSDVLAENVAGDFARLVPGCQVRQVAGATHTVVGDENTEFSSVIVEFLQATIRHGTGVRT